MKVIRTISIVIVVIGLFVWFLTPFTANLFFQSSDGVPASAIVFSGDSPSSLFLASVWKVQALHWMPLIGVILLILSLPLILLNEYRGLCGCSIVAISALIIGGKQIQDAVGTPILSIGYLLLLYCFIALLGLSIIAFSKANNVLRASGIMFAAWGGVLWFTAPFLSGNMFHDILDRRNAISSAALLSGDNQQLFPSIDTAWEATPIFWMSLITIILLGACLLLAILKRSHWSFLCSFAGIATLISGGILASVKLPLQKEQMHLGLGFFLLIGVFALLAYFSIAEMIDIKNSAKAKLLDDSM